MRSETKKSRRKGVLAGIILATGMFSFVLLLPHVIKPVEEVVHGTPLAYHAHVSVDYIVDGVHTNMPAYIGIENGIWPTHYLEGEGPAGMAPLHTHDTDNIIHIEPLQNKTYTLGDFFEVWGKDINNYKVCMNVLNLCSPLEDPSAVGLHDGDKFTIEMSTH